jgi:hypothetical protein
MKATNNTQRSRIALAKVSQIHQLVRPSLSDYLFQYQTSLMGAAAKAFQLVRYSLLAFLGPLASRDISVFISDAPQVLSPGFSSRQSLPGIAVLLLFTKRLARPAAFH